MSASRFTKVTETEHTHEARAIDYLISVLDDSDPYAAWFNFEFVAHDGSIYEIDALVLTPAGLFLVEIKSFTGHLIAGSNHWDYTSRGGKRRTFTNPRILANRKAKKLASLIGAHWEKSAGRPPFIESVVFLSEAGMAVQLDDRGEHGLVFHSSKRSLARVDRGLMKGEIPGVRAASPPIGRKQMLALRRALEKIGVRKLPNNPKVNGWELGELIDDGPRHQDFIATKSDVTRRLRVFPWGNTRDQDERASLSAAAKREFLVLESLNHPNILGVKDKVEDSRGPALVFEHPDGFERLDAFLHRNHAALSAAERIDIALMVASAVRHAHTKSVTHRALCPHAVLIRSDYPKVRLDLRLMDWHLAGRQTESDPGTQHLHAWQSAERMMYLAPEALGSPEYCSELTDVYGLGALLAFLLTAHPPAEDLADLQRRIGEDGGIRLSTRFDDVHPTLDGLVRTATSRDERERQPSVANFVDDLERARKTLEMPEEVSESVLDAKQADVIGGERFLVEKRLGKGSSALALLVHDTQREGPAVLKIALNHGEHARLAEEAKVLRRISSKYVVELHEELVLDPGGHHALLMQVAGEKSLRSYLREVRQLSLGDLGRFGEDLCQVLVDIEEAGVLHRDIKPDNLGLAAPGKVRKQLLAYDFSLAGVPVGQLRAGTPGYIDPFASERGKHDEYSDRYSAAVTLHEMATGARPEWGDGRTDPTVDKSVELTLQESLFPLAVRDSLGAFFRRALARDHGQRFDNAAEMRDAWNAVFNETLHTTIDTDTSDIEAVLATLTATSSLAELQLSEAAMDALSREGVETVGGLMGFARLAFLSAAGGVRAELEKARELALKLVSNPVEDESKERRAAHEKSIDELADYLGVQRKASGLEEPLLTRARTLIGLHQLPTDALQPGADLWRWPDTSALAEESKLSVPALRADTQAIVERWRRKKAVPPLLADVARLIRRHDGAMTARDLGRALLGLRGSLASDQFSREQKARAVVRAVALMNAEADEPIFTMLRRPREIVFCARPELLEHLPSLGAKADELVAPGKPVSSVAAAAALGDILPSALADSIGRHRLIRIASGCSANASVSGRAELYPYGMSADRALAALARPLSAAPVTRESQLRTRVRERFPEAEPLPSMPALFKVIRASGVPLTQGENAGNETTWQGRPLGVSLPTSFATSAATSAGAVFLHDERSRRVREADEHLKHLRAEGGFCALVAEARRSVKLESALCERFDLTRVSAEKLWVDAMREVAEAGRIDVERLFAADAPDAGPADVNPFRMRFLPAVHERVRTALHTLSTPTLLVENGLFARYDAIDLLTELREALAGAARTPAASRAEGGADAASLPSCVWLLLPADAGVERPKIDKTEVPTVLVSERYRLPSVWVSDALKRTRS